MKNKFFFHVGLLMLISAIGLSSCKKVDIDTTLEKIGSQKVPGIYAGVVVDTLAMQSTIIQIILEDTTDGGSYRRASSGHKLPINEEKRDLTWRSSNYVDSGMALKVTAISQGWEQVMYYANNQLQADSVFLSKYIIDMVDIYKTLDSKLGSDETWVGADTTFYYDTTIVEHKYLKWETKIASVSADSVAKLRAYFAQQWVKDTIAWYNKTYSQAIPDSARFAKTPDAIGLYKGVIPVSTEVTEKTEKHTVVGAASINYMKLYINRSVACENTMSYLLYEEANSREYFKDPTSPKAVHKVHSINMPEGNWAISAVTNVKTFSLQARGDMEEKTDGTSAISKRLFTFAIDGYSATSMTCNGTKLMKQ